MTSKQDDIKYNEMFNKLIRKRRQSSMRQPLTSLQDSRNWTEQAFRKLGVQKSQLKGSVKMEILVRDENGFPIDAKIEIVSNAIILQSRGGTKGTKHAKNTDYSTALRLLLARFQYSESLFVSGIVDSSRVQEIADADRQVLYRTDLAKSPQELFTIISRRMQAVGKPPSLDKRHAGNANKRIRFNFSNSSLTDLVQIANGNMTIIDRTNGIDLSLDDLYWTEGDLRLVSHLKRERASGLSVAKKAAFIQDHGTLFCEMCHIDPVAAYKNNAASVLVVTEN